jgi:outer membrane protein OmpA-like peptidoglycan-associated protein
MTTLQTTNTENKAADRRGRTAVMEPESSLHPVYGTSVPGHNPGISGSAQASPVNLSAYPALPRGASNQAILRGLSASPPRIQTKLTVNQPGDQYEQEADRVADRVMRMPEPCCGGPTLFSLHPAVQRKCSCDGEGGEYTASREEKKLQRSASGSPALQTAPPSVDATLRSPGQPLDAATRAFMEPRFGRDFGQTRLHFDGQAAQSANEVNALAYTVGHDIVLGAAQYNPASHAGRHLLAHELTHVIQQHQEASLLGMKSLSFPVQRQVDAHILQRACGEAPIREALRGRSTHLVLGDPGVKGQLVRFRVGCDEFLNSAAETALRNVATLPKRTRIIIHGFASEEGPPMFNLLLSQARAEKVKDFLSGLIDPAQIERTVMHGAIPGARADRRSAIIETLAASPLVTKTLSIVSWIDGRGLPSFSKTIILDPGTIRVIEAACMALGCTANTAPPKSLPQSSLSSFIGTKQYRAVQSYTLTYIPSATLRGTFSPLQIVGFTAPSSCSDIPPSTFRQGEASPLNHATPDMSGADPKAEALMKFRVSAAEESAAIGAATSFPASLFFSRHMLRHVPWVWTEVTLRLDATTGLLHWSVQGSAFPSHTVYLDGAQVAEIRQGPCGVVVASKFRTADLPRQTMTEEAKQTSVPISAQDETVDPGGAVAGQG